MRQLQCRSLIKSKSTVTAGDVHMKDAVCARSHGWRTLFERRPRIEFKGTKSQVAANERVMDHGLDGGVGIGQHYMSE